MFRLTLVAAAAIAAFAFTAPGHAADAKQMEENKKVVLDFYDKAINQKDFEAAAKYLGPRYTQHNPMRPTAPTGSGHSCSSCARSSRAPAARSSGSSPTATTSSC